MTSKAKTTTVADLIKELEYNETRAFLINDFDAINKIWHPEFTVNTPLNRILKAAEIQDAMRAELIKYSLLERNIEEILLRENVVITLGNEVTIPIENAPMVNQTVTRRFTNIWIKENNEWRLFSRHASNICD